jgi:hypothetical protein
VESAPSELNELGTSTQFFTEEGSFRIVRDENGLLVRITQTVWDGVLRYAGWHHGNKDAKLSRSRVAARYISGAGNIYYGRSGHDKVSTGR